MAQDLLHWHHPYRHSQNGCANHMIGQWMHYKSQNHNIKLKWISKEQSLFLLLYVPVSTIQLVVTTIITNHQTMSLASYKGCDHRNRIGH